MIGRTRVKICGLTRIEDAALAVELGADAVGFVFWQKSPRAVTRDGARDIARALPALATRVGVFVNAPPAEVAEIASTAGLDAIQLHGDERVEEYSSLAPRLIKAVDLADDAAVAVALAVPSTVTVLVDVRDVEHRGGTGRQADWERAALVSRTRPLMLAGGLTPENVARAVRQVRPWAVDVSSGVEAAPGVKSPERLRAFFRELTRTIAEDV
jgi:phosphoribosylanthranilate isomerase